MNKFRHYLESIYELSESEEQKSNTHEASEAIIHNLELLQSAKYIFGREKSLHVISRLMKEQLGEKVMKIKPGVNQNLVNWDRVVLNVMDHVGEKEVTQAHDNYKTGMNEFFRKPYHRSKRHEKEFSQIFRNG